MNVSDGPQTSMGCVLSQHDELGKKRKQSTTLARNFLTLNLVIPLWKQLVALVLRHYTCHVVNFSNRSIEVLF